MLFPLFILIERLLTFIR